MAKYDGISYKRPVNAGATLRRLAGYLKDSKWHVLAASLAAAVNGVVGVLGTYSYKLIINNFILARDAEGLIKGIIALACVYFCGATASLIYSQTMAKAAQLTVYRIRKDLFSKVQSLPLSFFDRTSSGDLMSRFTNDVETISDGLTNSYPTLVQSIASLISTIVMMLAINPWLALIVLVCQIMTSVYIRYATLRSRVFFTQQQGYLGKLNGFLQEMISGLKVVKLFNHEEDAFEEFSGYNDKLLDAAVTGTSYTGVMVPTTVAISYVNYALTALGGGLLCINGRLDIGSLTAFLICVRQAALPINQFTQQTTNLLSMLAGTERVFSLLDEESEIDEGTIICTGERNGKLFWHDTSDEGKTRDTALIGDISFSNIIFGYVPNKIILKDISFHAKAGSKAAFVGSTGAGKTTVINLVNRFYETDQGMISYDGIDIRKIRKRDLRKNIAIIVQTTHLFSGTIAENIRYGRIDARDEEVIEAAKLAHADSFIRRLPDGYQTVLRNDGDNLSQGQRQLLAIARAAIAKPAVLVLDEATSSVDTRTERLIEMGLDSLMQGRTVLVIAHRLSTVRNSDEIMVIEHGEIIERGSHAELLELDGRYAKLYLGQYELE